MASSFWLDDIILPKKGKELKTAEYAFANDTVILNDVSLILLFRTIHNIPCSDIHIP